MKSLKHIERKTKVSLTLSLCFLQCVTTGQPRSILDSVLNFYDKKVLSYTFNEVRHLANDKHVIFYAGQIVALKDKDSVFYQIDFGSKVPELKFEGIRNKNYYGRNDYGRNLFYDYTKEKEEASYFYDGNTPGHVFMQGDTALRRIFSDKDHLRVEEPGSENYLIVYKDTTARPTGHEGLLYWLAMKYWVSKQNYSIIRSEYDMTYLAGKAELHNRSEFSYNYYEIPEESVVKKINAFLPLKGIKKERPVPSLELPDSIKVFPSFNLEDSTHAMVKDKDLKARYVMVDFWYKSCGPCLANMKNLGTVRKSFSKEDLIILAVDIQEKADADLRRMVNGFDNDCMYLFEGKSLIRPLNLRAYPTTIVYENATKKIVYHHVGNSREATNELIAFLKQALNTQ